MVICSNCGFRNAAGDEFCGNCGRYLEFSGTPDSTDQAAAGAGGAGQPPAGQPPAGASQTWSGSGGGGAAAEDSPTVIQPPPLPNPGPAGAGMATGAAGQAPDVICWNCGKRNPAGRAFCMQCGTKLTAGGGAAAGAGAGMASGTVSGPAMGAGAAYRQQQPPPQSGGDGGGGGGRMLAIGAGFIALLLIAGLATAAFLGVFNGPASSGLVGVASPSPSALASGSALPTFSPGASASFGLPSIFPSGPVVTFAPPPTAEATRTPRPTCDINGAPHGCRPSPMPTPTSEPTATAEPTPISCAISTAADRSVTLTTEFPTRTIPQNFAWCVHDVTFTNASLAGATGTLKLFLENPEYIGPPGNYGMAKIGWPGSSGACEASIATDFASSTEYHPACTYPFGYDSITEGTIVSFEIVNCGTNGTCGGSVTIGFERIEAP